MASRKKTQAGTRLFEGGEPELLRNPKLVYTEPPAAERLDGPVK